MKSKKELFFELAKPVANGISRWVTMDEIEADEMYRSLMLGNGCHFGRKTAH